MAGLLKCHILDQVAVLDSEPSIEKILLAEDFKSVVEKIDLYKFLMDTKGN